MPIKIEGFNTSSNQAEKLNYVTVVHGPEFSGKTRFALTGPKPMGWLVNDPKTLDTIDKDIHDLGLDPEEILVTDNMSRLDNVMSIETTIKSAKDLESSKQLQETMEAYRNHLNRMKTRALALARHPEIVCCVIDSGTITYEDVCYALCGRTSQIPPLVRPAINREFLDIIQIMAGAKTLKGRRKHLIITARTKEIYIGDQKSGRFEPEGCSKIGYFVKNVIELRRVNDKKDLNNLNAALAQRGEKAPADTKYYMNLQSSLRNPRLASQQGKGILLDDTITYPNIMGMVYDQVDPDEWF